MRHLYAKTVSPVHIKFQTTVAAMYMTAVSLNTGSKDPVFSTTNPTAETPRMPANDPKVFASPKSRPAYLGAISDMFATKPACPASGNPMITCMPLTDWHHALGSAVHLAVLHAANPHELCTLLHELHVHVSFHMTAAPLHTAQYKHNSKHMNFMV